MKLMDYRGLYESSVSLLLYNVTKDIAIMLSKSSEVKFKKKNKFTFGGKAISGIVLREDGFFITVDDGTEFELTDECEFYTSTPLNMITLFENIAKELGLNKQNKK